MIWQPKDNFLPDRALKPEWNARWKTVSDASGRPGASDSRASRDDCKYFIARGSFNNPREIPPHYHYADDEVPDAGASELERTYERKDYGFVVEHRWKEKITNIVTLPGFLKARDELLDLCLPVYIEAIEKIFGKDYDVSRLVNHLRVNGRRFLENVSLIVYDAVTRGRVMSEDGKLDVDSDQALVRRGGALRPRPQTARGIVQGSRGRKRERADAARSYFGGWSSSISGTVMGLR